MVSSYVLHSDSIRFEYHMGHCLPWNTFLVIFTQDSENDAESSNLKLATTAYEFLVN